MKKRITRADNEKQTAPSDSPRDWKFWVMSALTVFWCGLFGVAMVNNARNTSMPKWWADQIQAEEKSTVVPAASHAVKKSLSPAAYPKSGDYYQLSFDTLSSFPSDKTGLDPSANNKAQAAQIPPAIQALDGEKISVAGFMIPMITDKDQASSFILAQTRGSCCYGLVPKFNQWIYVEMSGGKTAEIIMDTPVTVFGTLAVNNHFGVRDKDWCLYRMAGEKVELPQKSWF